MRLQPSVCKWAVTSWPGLMRDEATGSSERVDKAETVVRVLSGHEHEVFALMPICELNSGVL
jgi:hypothetical protein